MQPTVHWGKDSHPHLAQIPQDGMQLAHSSSQPRSIPPTTVPQIANHEGFHCIHPPTGHAKLVVEMGRWEEIAWLVPALGSWVIKQRGDLTPLDVVASASLIPC